MEFLNRSRELDKTKATWIFSNLTSASNPNRTKFLEEFIEKYEKESAQIDSKAVYAVMLS